MRTVIAENTIDLVIDNSLDLTRYRRAMYSVKPVIFSHIGQNYRGTVVSVRPHVEQGPESWVVKVLAKLHDGQPPKRAKLKWEQRADGEFVVH